MTIDINKQYTTRDGRQVRIYATDAGGDYLVHGAIFQEEGNYYSTQAWKSDGCYYDVGTNKSDLIEAWTPEVDELCWFWNIGFKFMILGQYVETSDVTGFYICKGSLMGNQRIAQYIPGELPEPLKELK